ncbi:MAG: 1-deoxy-D-xylulose-5-phosphate reductoisomerase [Acetivibrionales bacterium]|jgi:1-deoxy-D-xylulose-5-phosphate reductoisomerase
MKKTISILGSTGSVGVQTIDVARNLNLKIAGLTAYENIDLLEKQAREFHPKVVAIADEGLAEQLEFRLRDLETKVYSGVEGLKKAACIEEVDTVVVSVVGIAGLIPTLEAIRNGKNVALANKEVLVSAGHIIMPEAKKNNVLILPVDSEHSAIFQSLMGNRNKDIEKIILTASGGPFRGRSLDEMRYVSVSEALKHPNWSMGKKITIDSATLMNKGLEVIEARWFFDVWTDQIQVLIHPQSIVHSMVEYADGSIISQMGPSDMRIPIQFALTYPERKGNWFERLDFLTCGSLTFEEPDYEAFPCLGLAFEALEKGGTMPAVLNAANEEAVRLFLDGVIGFLDIPAIIRRVMDMHSMNINPCLDDIIEVDKWARQIAVGCLNLKK